MSNSVDRWGLIGVLLLSLLAFAPTLANGYPMDDEFLAMTPDAAGKERVLVAEVRPVGEYFSRHWWHGHYEASELYRPTTKLSIALVHATGTGAFGQHAVNLLIHVWAAWLVFRLVSLLATRRAALAAALAFGVHAIHTEAVALVVGRCDLLAFCFGAQALDVLARGPTVVWRVALAAGLAFLGFCSKEVAVGWVAFLPLFVLMRRFAGDRVQGPAARHASLALAAVVPGLIAFLWLRQSMIGSLPVPVPEVAAAANPLVELGFLDRILTATKILGFALGKALFPVRLASDHGIAVFDSVRAIGDPGFLVSAAILVGWLAVGLLFLRRQPLLFLAMAAFLGFAFPTSNLPFAIGTVFAERLYYLPSFGVALLVAWAWGLAERKGRVAMFLFPFVLWIGHNAVYSFRRSFVFRDTFTLAAHDVHVRPDSATLQRNAGQASLAKGQFADAERHLEEATKLDPGFAASWLFLADAQVRRGDVRGAIRTYRAGLERSREEMRVERGALHMNLGVLLLRGGQAATAATELAKAVEIDPSALVVHDMLLEALAVSRSAEHAARLAAAKARFPAHPLWSYHAGRSAQLAERWRIAERELRSASRHRSAPPKVWTALAEVLVKAGSRDEAVRIGRRVLGVRGLDPALRARAEAVVGGK